MTDYTLADTIYLMFTTRAFATGVPTTLAGTPVVSAYENDSATQITAGITLGVDHDTVTGLNLLTIVATGANGYEAGKDYNMVITTGTVSSVSVVGEVVGTFSLQRSAAAVDLANGTDGLGAIKAETAAILTDTAEIGTAGAGLTNIGTIATVTNLTNAPTNGDLTATMKTSVTTAATAATPTAAAVTGAVGSVTGNVGGIAGTITTLDGLDTAQDSQHAQTQSDIAALNDIAATDIVSAGAITTLAGAVVNVDLVDTTTTNTDMVAAAPTAVAIADQVWDEAIAGHAGAGSTGEALSNATAPTAAAVADAVWDETLSGHLGAGSTGEALNAAGAAGDPWTTALPGAYGAGSAGLLLGTTIPGNLSDIETDTAQIGAAGAGLTNINLPNQTMDITGNITGNLSGSVGSVVGHTPQTGDTFALANGAAGFVAIDTNVDSLISALVTGILAEPNNETLIEQLKMITAVVEHQRGAHTHQPIGNIFFVDPTNGATHGSGARGGITDPYSLVQDCHDNAVTDSNHDLIILLSGTAAGSTTLTEAVTISKRYLFIRGPGRDFIWTRSGNGDTITITADGVALEGFQINTAATGAGNGITVTSADFFKANLLWLNNTQGDAIELTNCDNFVIQECTLQGSGVSGSGHGIQVLAGAGQTGSYGKISRNYINAVQGDGIQIDTTGGGTVEATVIEYNLIQGCTDDGIDIVDSGCTNTIIRDNRLGNNTSNDIEDAGTTSLDINNVQFAKHSIATEARLAELDAANIPADIAAVKAETALIVADTNELQTDNVPGLISALNNVSVADILTTQMTESYAADGAAPTLTQALMMIQQMLGDFAISGTTLTVKQVDGATTAATFTLNDGTNPTSLTRST